MIPNTTVPTTTPNDVIKAKAINLFNGGKTYGAIARELSKTGFRTATGSKPTVGYISNLLYRARKQGFVPSTTAVDTTTTTNTQEFLRNILPVTGRATTVDTLAKKDLIRAVIGTPTNVFSLEYKTNVVAVIAGLN